jgi:hypothetical protein
MTTRTAGVRKFAASLGIASVTLMQTSASPTAGALPLPGTVRFVDLGGPVLNQADVYLLHWGNTWTAAGTSYPTSDEITAAITTLIAGPYLTGLGQYRGIKPAVIRESSVVTSSDPPASFTDEQVGDFLDIQLDAGLVPDSDRDHQALYIVVMPVGAYSAGGSPAEHIYYERHGQRIPFA